MLKKKKFKMQLVNINGIYIRTLLEGVYVQILLFCVIHTVGMTSYPPVFNPRPSNVTVRRGEYATLQCSISNLGSMEVIWKKTTSKHALTIGTFVFYKDPSFSVKYIPHKDEWNLGIENVQPKHAGKYECQVSTKEDMSRYVTLTVIEREQGDTYRKFPQNYEPVQRDPEIHISGPEIVKKGHPLILACNATGTTRAPKTITWFHEGVKINSNAMAGIDIKTFMRPETKSTYSILSVKRSDTTDTGTFICKSSDLKLTTHELLVLNGIQDSNPIKRGTGTDSNIEVLSDSGTRNSQTRSEPALRTACLLFIVTVFI